MSLKKQSLQQIKILEDLVHRDTLLTRIPAAIKLVITFFYILTVISFKQHDLGGLLLFACVPVFFMIIGEIPMKILLSRCIITLPFAFFVGLSNLFYSSTVVVYIGKLGITLGMISLTTLLLKTILTVMSVLLLVASTSMNELIYALISLHIPYLLVIQIMMTYRYMSVLMNEASLMYQGYLLRAPKQKGIKIKDMGTFIGQLILRSTDRAERIYQGMLCRGFEGNITFTRRKKLGLKGWLVILVAGLILIALRIVPLGEMIQSLFMA